MEVMRKSKVRRAQLEGQARMRRAAELEKEAEAAATRAKQDAASRLQNDPAGLNPEAD